MKFRYTTYTNKNNNIGIIVEGYTFYEDRQNNNQYRCSSKQCKTRATIIDENYVQLSSNHCQHKENSEQLIQKKNEVEIIKKTCT